MQIYRYPDVWCNHHVHALETTVLKGVRILRPFLRNNITMLLIQKVKKSVLFLSFVNNFHLLIVFSLLFHFVNVPHFSL